MVLKDKSDKLFETVVDVLSKRGIVIMRGDTIYGFFGIAPETKGRIQKLKRREEGKEFLMLVPDASWVKRFSDNKIPESLLAHWPGPLTIIMNVRAGAWNSDTVALRVPDDEFLRQVLFKIDRPLYSTSVNISGDREINSIGKIVEKFGESVELIVDSGDAIYRKPSTIVDITSGELVIVREGAIEASKL